MAKETDFKDSVCECVHWFEEHEEPVAITYPDVTVRVRSCGSPGCDCGDFVADRVLNTPQAIGDRGGEHDEKTCNCNLCRSLRGQPLREF
jgi:hypothetical protein